MEFRLEVSSILATRREQTPFSLTPQALSLRALGYQIARQQLAVITFNREQSSRIRLITFVSGTISLSADLGNASNCIDDRTAKLALPATRIRLSTADSRVNQPPS
jgi:hypothetical protein